MDCHCSAFQDEKMIILIFNSSKLHMIILIKVVLSNINFIFVV